jgi:hypothetical protein
MIMDGKNFREIKCNCWSTEERKRECDNTGVDIQVRIIKVVKFYSRIDIKSFINEILFFLIGIINNPSHVFLFCETSTHP